MVDCCLLTYLAVFIHNVGTLVGRPVHRTTHREPVCLPPITNLFSFRTLDEGFNSHVCFVDATKKPISLLPFQLDKRTLSG